MNTIYEVHLEHFTIVEGVAKANAGDTRLRNIDSLELLQILMIFQDISPIQHFEGEPTITILTRKGSRHLVRTDLNKLILSDPRDVIAPSRVLEAASILLEIEDQTGDKRRHIRSSLTEAAHHQQERHQRQHPKPSDIPGRAGPRDGLQEEVSDRITKTELWSIAALSMSVLLLGAHWWATLDLPAPLPAPSPVKTSNETLRLGHGLIGTYMTGKNPGDYAIIVWDAQRLSFLELGATPPAEHKASYTLAQQDGQVLLCVNGHEPITAGRDALRMGKLLFTRQ